MFQEIEDESFNERELRILKQWTEEKSFQESLKNREKAPLFVFYDGPPFATGLPHYGHLLAGTIKDTIQRYKTMKGYYVPRRFGWDCHGLPVENEIEKTFKLSGGPAIEEFGIANFNEECRKIVLRYTEEWKETVLRMGRWVDFDLTYRTMDKTFMESVWWVFQQLFQKGLVYEGFKVMPYSAKLGTPLSNFEAGENYKDVDDPSLTIEFQLIDEPETSILAWTTTPWTLPSNLALLVGPHIQYVKIKDLKTNKQSTLQKPYIGFKDYGPPLKDGKIDKEFLQTFGLKIPEKHYMALGDNHAMSADSRYFGFIPQENLQGSPSFIVWPPGPRWGIPSQKPYAWATLPNAVVWGTALGLGLFWYILHRRKMSQPVFHKVSK